MIEFLPLLLLFVLLLLGIPIAYSLIIVGGLGLVIAVGPDASVGFLQARTYGSVSGYTLVTVPMFILMAEFLRVSGLTRIMFDAFNAWLGHFRGGLAISTTIANGGLAALSGSSAATAATMASVAIPEMRRFDYDDRLSLGTVSAGGTFASMLPPSVILIVYGITTGTSIPQLFAAGIIPGIITVLGYIVVIYIWAKRDPSIIGGEPQPKSSLQHRIDTIKPIGPALLVVVITVGALLMGVVTPTESGALGAAGVLVVAYIFSGLRPRDTMVASARALETTTMIFMLIIGATVFGLYLTLTGIASEAVTSISNLPFSPLVIIFLVLCVYLALGTVMTGIPILLLTLPVTFPIATDLGFSPIWFGIVVVKTLEMGLVTPPFGLNVFIASGAAEVEPDIGFRGAARFLVVDFVILLLLLAAPKLALWLPGRV